MNSTGLASSEVAPSLWTRFRRAMAGRQGLDYLLARAEDQRTPLERLEWLREVIAWIRVPPRSGKVQLVERSFGHGQILRLRYLMQTLDRNPLYKSQVARTLRALLREIDSLEVFRSAGLPGGLGLWSEAMHRFNRKLIPESIEGKDLGEAFDVLFPSRKDGLWLSKIDGDLLTSLGTLLNWDVGEQEGPWNTITTDMAEALVLLAIEAQALASVPFLRRRRAEPNRSEFLHIQEGSKAFLANLEASAKLTAGGLGDYLQSLQKCLAELVALRETLQKEGVSLSLVYASARLEAIVMRMQTLATLLARTDQRGSLFLPFIVRLSDQTRQQSSLRALWSENAALLARRITERNADTGQHYITRNIAEYRSMFLQACGGGLLTGLTVVVKIIVTRLPINYLAKGLLTSLNYSVSFLAIQFAGFTLATKQPAMTAAAIASRITDLSDDREIAKLVGEVIHLVRSQVAAIFGNVLTVVPAAWACQYLILQIRGEGLISNEEAHTLLAEHSIFGPSLIFAAFTGVILWLSSVIAGWSDNWVALNKVPSAIANNRRLKFFLGPANAARLGSFIEHRATALGGNISLGFLMGMLPKMLAFAGLHYDVRHVTLSSGMVTFAAATLGSEIWHDHAFWQAALCMVFVGVLNVGVAFAIAISVAIKSRQVDTQNKRRVYKALFSRMIRRPWQVLLPVGLPQAEG